MHTSRLTAKFVALLSCYLICCQQLLAHNGTVGYAYPLGKITIDGNFSEWPKDMVQYKLGVTASDTKPLNEADFSGSFRIGYRMEDRSLYVALQLTDDDFIEDTSANVRWNSQDGLEIYLDARHLPAGSGVASFMYSKKLRNTNNAYYDPFAKDAKWNIIEVAFVKKGNTRYYEWRIMLGDQFKVGKSIGIDFQAFDLDGDKSFSYNSWGAGDMKYVNPRSLSDVILMPAKAKLSTLSGSIAWDHPANVPLPKRVRLLNMDDAQRWLTTAVDSTGNYTAAVPAGQYAVDFPEPYFHRHDTVYATMPGQPLLVNVPANGKASASPIVLPATPVPNLIPDKGVALGDFNETVARQIDHFIKTYQQYYEIPGVSFALIKDGKPVYHQTYGVRNTFTREPVDSNTLFEAASVTKPVFAFAVQRLAERGVIDLDKPLYLYLPYPDIAYDERYKLITAKHVLTHRTGFPNWRSMNADGKLDLKFTPGTDFGYSGEGFEYLKLVVEKITGKKVEQVLQEEVIAPTGLYHTFFSRNDSLRRMVAAGHYNSLPNYDELPETPGMAYSMHTEAKIFTRFMQYLLDQKGLQPATYDSMFAKHSDYHFDPGEEKPKVPTYMGMSFEIRETPFGKTFSHGGNNGDFKCKFEVYKDLNMGYVLFTNSNTSDVLLGAIRYFLVEGKQE
ncbi:serine hydrolase [uncultured Chitinophaga sp.]|jgi:Beta-lactamase class C and other penicillin binding proteins|uniref:serine hydrolase n=1 Tax=uncultured Chitinophaga sp. TaxID=339340 RepID=UPI00262D1140|nr:serine hydrolase [uncultured Chitinophaga sp.]